MSTTITARAETLAGIEYFNDLSAEDRQGIARLVRARSCCRGRLVFSHGEQTHDVCFVVSGKVRVAHYAPSGRETTLRVLGAGSCFGDLAALDGQAHSADVIAHEDTLLLCMKGSDFVRLVARHDAIRTAVLRKLVALVRQLSDRVVEFSTLSVDSRIDAEVLRLARTAGTQRCGMIEVRSPPTHAEIAAQVSTHREAVTREINRLKRLGVMQCGRSCWTISDLGTIRERAAGGSS